MTEREAVEIALAGGECVAAAMRRCGEPAPSIEITELCVFTYLLIVAGVPAARTAEITGSPVRAVLGRASLISECADHVPAFGAVIAPFEDVAAARLAAEVSAAQRKTPARGVLQ